MTKRIERLQEHIESTPTLCVFLQGYGWYFTDIEADYFKLTEAFKYVEEKGWSEVKHQFSAERRADGTQHLVIPEEFL